MPSKGYLLGKLFAQLEREGAVHTQDYQVASMSPTQIIVPALPRLAEMGKADTIIDVMNTLPMDAFDGQPLSPSDQADFPLGYYQEKAKSLSKVAMLEETQFTAQLLIRLEPSLKEWVLKRGGSKFVRELLRRERAKEISS
jgi:hypothetical protein